MIETERRGGRRIVQELLKEWKERLGLQDWYIELRDNCSSNDMVLKDCAGETEWQEVGKCAVIRIISKRDYGDRIVPFDKEKTLVHELLHCKFCLLGESGCDLQDRIQHQLIDDIAKALVNAKRGVNGERN